MAKKNNFTWAQACRDIVRDAMNKGQLIPLGLLAFLLIGIVRVPENELPKLAESVLSHVLIPCGPSYIYMFLTVGVWFLHVKYIRREFHSEMERIGNEKTALQTKLVGAKLPSSKSL